MMQTWKGRHAEKIVYRSEENPKWKPWIVKNISASLNAFDKATMEILGIQILILNFFHEKGVYNSGKYSCRNKLN